MSTIDLNNFDFVDTSGNKKVTNETSKKEKKNGDSRDGRNLPSPEWAAYAV